MPTEIINLVSWHLSNIFYKVTDVSDLTLFIGEDTGRYISLRTFPHTLGNLLLLAYLLG